MPSARAVPPSAPAYPPPPHGSPAVDSIPPDRSAPPQTPGTPPGCSHKLSAALQDAPPARRLQKSPLSSAMRAPTAFPTAHVQHPARSATDVSLQSVAEPAPLPPRPRPPSPRAYPAYSPPPPPAPQLSAPPEAAPPTGTTPP